MENVGTKRGHARLGCGDYFENFLISYFTFRSLSFFPLCYFRFSLSLSLHLRPPTNPHNAAFRSTTIPKLQFPNLLSFSPSINTSLIPFQTLILSERGSPLLLRLLLMAPIRLKQSPPSKTLPASQDARILVRETIRISADLASAAPPSSIEAERRRGDGGARTEMSFGLVDEGFLDSSLRVLCFEEIDGRRWKYVAEKDGRGRLRKSSIRAIGLQAPDTPMQVS